MRGLDQHWIPYRFKNIELYWEQNDIKAVKQSLYKKYENQCNFWWVCSTVVVPNVPQSLCDGFYPLSEKTKLNPETQWLSFRCDTVNRLVSLNNANVANCEWMQMEILEWQKANWLPPAFIHWWKHQHVCFSPTPPLQAKEYTQHWIKQ